MDKSYAFHAAYVMSLHVQIPHFRTALEAVYCVLFSDAVHVDEGVMIRLQ